MNLGLRADPQAKLAGPVKNLVAQTYSKENSRP